MVVKTESYKLYTKASGQFALASNKPALIAVKPAGLDFYYLQKTDEGEFLSEKFAALDKTPKNLSKDLDDAVAVDLFVFFIKDVYAFQGSAANIKIKTQISLV